MAQGVTVFKTVAEALRAGYSIIGKTDTGYQARILTSDGWAMALIVLRGEPCV